MRNDTVRVVSGRGRLIERVIQRLFSFIDTASSCFVTVTLAAFCVERESDCRSRAAI